ncbi:MAG: peptidylprolyl isomerase [Candidatus Latescibacteria bacterium]|nr:peptidylprolyl isomerase [Candidatus Latescibacterota bacterium]
MLKTMRQAKTIKTVMWVVSIAFVGWLAFELGADYTGRASRTRAVVGQINGRAVSFEEFKAALQNTSDRQRTQTPDREPDQGQLIQQVWDDMVNQILLLQEIEKRNIAFSDKELAQYLRTAPPPYIQQTEAFLTNGQFDIGKYNQFLNQMATSSDPRARQNIDILAYQTRLALQGQKLQDQIMASVKATDAEVRKQYIDQNEKVKVMYLFVPNTPFSDSAVTVSDEETKKYYQEHTDDYRQDARVRCEYVLFEKKASPDDERAVEREIHRILTEARGGADFAQLARDYSEDPGSAQNGGDLGFFGRGHMVKPFEDVAFALSPGDISEPVKTPFGWHIVKVEEKKLENGEEQVKARHILLKIQPSRETIEDRFTRAEQLVEEAKKNGLSKAAQGAGLDVKDTGFFEKKGVIPGLGGGTQALVNLAFESSEGTILRPYENDRGIFVLHVAQKKKAGIEPFEDVKEKVVATLKTKKKTQLSSDRLRQSKGQTLEQKAASIGLSVKETPLFSRTGYVPGVGSKNEFTAAAFHVHPVGAISDIVETDKGAYILQLSEKQPIDEIAFESQKAQLRERLLQQKQYETYNTWFTHLKETAKIVDNRHLFYSSF